MKDMLENVKLAEAFLKSLANKSRLRLLCQMVEGEQSVNALVEATNIAQSSVSQHLAKLAAEGVVDYRREHRILYYRIVSTPALSIMQTLYETFCKEKADEK